MHRIESLYPYKHICIELEVYIHISIYASFYFYILQLFVPQNDIHNISFFQNIDEIVVMFSTDII
jgi:hypothetical protein